MSTAMLFSTFRQLAPVTLMPWAPTIIRLPLFVQRVPAGFPSPADDYLEDGCDLNELLIRNAPATFLYRVGGDSLNRRGIMDGDYVAVDRSIEPQTGHVVVAWIPGDGHAIKILQKLGDRIVLKPDSLNPVHAPRSFADGQEVYCIGVVTGVIRKLL